LKKTYDSKNSCVQEHWSRGENICGKQRRGERVKWGGHRDWAWTWNSPLRSGNDVVVPNVQLKLRDITRGFGRPKKKKEGKTGSKDKCAR